MGRVATRVMAGKGWHVIMTVRNMQKGQTLLKELLEEQPNISLELQELEMSSRESIQAFAERMNGRQIDALFHNAGIMQRNYTTTKEGIETTMAVNFLHSALLINLLTPMFPKGAHIVNMVSLTTRFAHLDISWPQWSPSRFQQLKTYSSSKLAFLLWTIAYKRHNPDLIVNVSDPGIVDSNMITMHRWYDPLADIFFRPFIKTPQQGVAPALRALEATESLLYYVGGKNRSIPHKFLDNSLCDELYRQVNMICPTR